MNSYTISVKNLGMLKFVNDKIVQLYIEKKKNVSKTTRQQAFSQKLCDIIADPFGQFL